MTRQRDAKDRRGYSLVAVEQVKRVDAMYRKHSQKMAALLETYDDAAFEGLLQYLNHASALIGDRELRASFSPSWKTAEPAVKCGGAQESGGRKARTESTETERLFSH